MWMHRYQPILGLEALGILSLSEVRPAREHVRGERCGKLLGTKDNVLGSMSIVLKYVAICLYACHDPEARRCLAEESVELAVLIFI